MLKRFMIFGYDTYYPGGGMNDFMESFSSLADATQYLIVMQKKYNYDNIEIFDQKYEKVVDPSMY